MPVNMDPKKRSKRAEPGEAVRKAGAESKEAAQASKNFGETTERDKELDLADAEWKHLWDATEVIDMDRW
ncbi:MAG: hypothetical protein HY581_00185 [Nitrospirae bacterium]|nr:hypothetical protein [Nitrospirota bacterium]